ncbi:MAG: hypothetical protein ACTHM9_10590 [Gemmatimonadales bacterium]
MRALPQAILTTGLLITACGEKPAPAPVVILRPAHDTVPTEFTDVTTGAWLGGSRWAVLAPPDEHVGLADAATHTLGELAAGKSGKELRNPSTLFRAGDTLYIGDWGLRRIAKWTLDGRFAGAVPTTDAVRGALPTARDAAARFYLELRPRPGPDGSGNRDSAVIVRAAPALDRTDTIARLAPFDIAKVTSDAGERFERRVFSGADVWGVLPDGALWVGRVYDNRVDWRDPAGTWRRGDPLPDRVLEVTRYDRELFVRRFPPELRATAEQLPFAPVKPPFEAGLTSPGGDAWLEKSRAPVDSSRRYQVIDRQGELRAEVRVPGPGRIVALSPDAALVAEPSRDGVRLLRFDLPAIPSPGASH